MDYMTLTIAAVVFLLTTVYASIVYWKYKDLPPGPYGLPLLGYAPFLNVKPHIALRNLAKKYGNILSINLGGVQTVVISDWPSIREVLIRQGETFSSRPYIYMFDVIFQGTDNDIASLSGPVHKELKRMTLQILKNIALGHSSLESLVLVEVEKIVEHLKMRDGQLIDISSVLFVPTVNIIWRITTGNTFDNNDSDMKSFCQEIQTMTTLNNVGILNVFPALRFVAPQLTGYTKLANAAKKTNRYIKHIVDQHYDDQHRDGQQTDFINVFIEEIKKRRKDNKEQPPYCKKNLVGAVTDMFDAGGETSNTTLHWALLMMAYYPDIQKKVQQELDEKIAPDSYIAYASKSTIPYTEATLCEVHRIGSILPLGIAHCAARDAMLSGYNIRKGTTVLTNIWALHHDQEYWGDPEVFRPERFLDDEGRLMKHDKYIPFSAGPRSCPGESLAKLEMTLFFSSLLRRFSFERDPNQASPASGSPIETRGGFIIRPCCASVIVHCR